MKYIKSYYDTNDYTNILNHFFKIFINDNFINISKYEELHEQVKNLREKMKNVK